ncbi:MAG: hypothetical protein WKF96_23495 [Solirubrobacteraceae bacterium]
MRRSGENGFVMVTVMVVMGFALVLGGVAVAGAVQSRSAAIKDVRAKRAQQAADAGLSATLYRLNQLSVANVNFSGGLSALSQSLACQGLLTFNTSVNVGFADVSAGTSACGSGRPAVPPGKFFDERLGDQTRAEGYVFGGPTATPSAKPELAPTRLQPVVVSVGRDDAGTADPADDVIRRVRAKLDPVRPFQGLEAMRNLEFDTDGVAVTATTLNGAALANGQMSIVGGLASTFTNSNLGVAPLNVTGSISYYGPSLINVTVALTTLNATTEPPVSRKRVTVAATKPDCPSTGCPAQYSSATRNLVASSGTVTLPGGDYVFCKVAITGSATLRPEATAEKPVRIFVDDPASARCAGNAADAANGNITVTGRIDPGVTLQPSQLQFYPVGIADGSTNEAARRSAVFNTTTSALSLLPGFFVYGPTTNVALKYTTFTGTLVGYDVRATAAGTSGSLLGLTGVGTYTQDLNVNNLPLSSQLGVFSVAEYGECAAQEVTLATVTDNC